MHPRLLTTRLLTPRLLTPWLLTPSPLFPPKFTALLQACADDVPADPKQAGRFQLITIAIFVGGAHHVSFNGFVKMAATLLEEAEEGILE